jgi:UDP-N-acetylmuramate: L-alanyl-gamma-D-glutamyl-meso-diaminopimelate ligase
VQETIDGIRQRYAGRRLIAAFEPRSNTSRRNIHQEAYVDALREADAVFLKIPEPHDQVPMDQQLDVGKIVTDLRGRGIAAQGTKDVDELVRLVADAAKPGDVILVMSNGAFGNFVPKIIAALGGQ